MRDERTAPCAPMRRTPAGIRAGDQSSRLPAHGAQWHRHVSCSRARATNFDTLARQKRAWDDLQLALRSLTVAGAAQVGSSSIAATSLPVSRLTASTRSADASTKSAASVGARFGAVKKTARADWRGAW